MKYGVNSFEQETLYEFITDDKKYAYSIEQNYIDKYCAVTKGYNMDIGFGWNIVDRKGSKNPMYGKISGNAKKVLIYGKQYDSITIAARELGMNVKTLNAWIRSKKAKYNNYCYVN